MLDDLAVRECGSGMITGRYVRSVAMRVVEQARRSPSCSAMRNGRVRRAAWGGGAVSLLAGRHSGSASRDRKRVEWGKGVLVRVYLGGRGLRKKKIISNLHNNTLQTTP